MSAERSEDTTSEMSRQSPAKGRDETEDCKLNARANLIRTPEKWKKSNHEADYSNESITDTILSSRRQHQEDVFPAYSPSASKSAQSRRDDQTRRLKQVRSNKRDQKLCAGRGGVENMEHFIMKSEYQQELERLTCQAEQYVVPPDMVETMEKEHQEDLEDHDLIEYIEMKDQMDRELEEMLSELSIK